MVPASLSPFNSLRADDVDSSAYGGLFGVFWTYRKKINFFCSHNSLIIFDLLFDLLRIYSAFSRGSM
jgi:hypothetical protein